MTTNPDEIQLREAIHHAGQMREKVRAVTEEFPPEGKELRDKLRAAAERTVVNLELALEAFLKDVETVH